MVLSIYNAVESLQNMKFPGMASDVDEKGRTAEEKAEKGATLIKSPSHWERVSRRPAGQALQSDETASCAKKSSQRDVPGREVT